MRILFTKNNLPLSKAICKVTNEPVSHTAVELSSGIVIHSNFRGVHLEWSKNFRRKNQVLLELVPYNPYNSFPTIQSSELESPEKIDALLEKYEFSWYDIGALFFIGVRLLLKAWFKAPLPKQNLWQSSGMFICTEWVQEFIDEKNINSMITPYKLYVKLLKTRKWSTV